jgi:hypothetical protein
MESACSMVPPWIGERSGGGEASELGVMRRWCGDWGVEDRWGKGRELLLRVFQAQCHATRGTDRRTVGPTACLVTGALRGGGNNERKGTPACGVPRSGMLIDDRFGNGNTH